MYSPCHEYLRQPLHRQASKLFLNGLYDKPSEGEFFQAKQQQEFVTQTTMKMLIFITDPVLDIDVGAMIAK